MTELVQILTAISLLCADGIPRMQTAPPYIISHESECKAAAWKCIDKVRKKKEKIKCQTHCREPGAVVIHAVDDLPVVCDSFDFDKEMEKCFR